MSLRFDFLLDARRHGTHPCSCTLSMLSEILISFGAGQGQIYESACKKDLKTGLVPCLSVFHLELSYQVAIDGAASLQIKPHLAHSIKTCIRVPEHQQL